jgi:LuxR family maltose regulon positive regulatory protein
MHAPHGSEPGQRQTAPEGPLLLTKLCAPQVRSGRVRRSRLLARLNRGVEGKLTLVSAPAGFGKTTLVSEWLEQLGRPSAWLSLDEGDNDPARFLAYLGAALQTVKGDWCRSVQERLHSSQPSTTTSLLVATINEITTSTLPFVLTLDDYHLISDQTVHETIAFLLDNIPPQMHLVIVTRADPPLPLARLRGRGELTEIRADDLRFTAHETAILLNQVMDLELTPQQIVALEARTEGWVAGLQLAALSLQDLPPGEVTGFIAAFTGSHRYVMDYLIAEVFGRQPPQIQDFLLQTSILDRLCGSLCDAVTGQADGQATLERLERANLFTVPLDRHRCWYRYHHLFADLLRDRLQQNQAESVPRLHHQAAKWYEHSGFMEAAVQHALAAKDFEFGARLAEQAAAALWSRSEVLTLLNWFNALPQALVRSRPFLCVNYAWSLALTGQLDAVEPLLHAIESYIDEAAPLSLGSVVLPPDLQETETTGPHQDKQGLILQRLRTVVDMLRASVARLCGNTSDAIAFSARALERIPADNPYLRGMALLFQGHAYLLEGNFGAAEQMLVEASAAGQATGHVGVYLSAIHYLAQLRVLQGRLREAMAVYRQAAQFVAKQPQPSLAGIERIGIGSLLCEWNDLEAASHHIRAGILLAETGGDFTFLRDGYIARARLEWAQGNWEKALASIHKAGQTVHPGQSAWNTAWLEAWQARLWVAQGDLPAAARWAQAYEGKREDNPDLLHEFSDLTLARVRLTQRRPGEAGDLLGSLLQSAGRGGRTGRVIEILTLQALAGQAQGRTTEAIPALERALSLAEPEGYVRTFVEEGAPMAGLLREALSRGIAPGYTGKLLAAFGETAAAQTLAEPLTQRELEVLRLIAAGLRNQEIADQLIISVATVKRHITNIYGKLGVSHRTQAVARAQELDLV